MSNLPTSVPAEVTDDTTESVVQMHIFAIRKLMHRTLLRFVLTVIVATVAAGYSMLCLFDKNYLTGYGLAGVFTLLIFVVIHYIGKLEGFNQQTWAMERSLIRYRNKRNT